MGTDMKVGVRGYVRKCMYVLCCWYYQARPPAMDGGCVSMDASNRGMWRARNISMSRYKSVVVRPVMIRVDEMPTRNTNLTYPGR